MYVMTLSSQQRCAPADCGVTCDVQVGTYADVTVKLGLIKLLTKQFDVCQELYVHSSPSHFVARCWN